MLLQLEDRIAIEQAQCSLCLPSSLTRGGMNREKLNCHCVPDEISLWTFGVSNDGPYSHGRLFLDERDGDGH